MENSPLNMHGYTDIFTVHAMYCNRLYLQPAFCLTTLMAAALFSVISRCWLSTWLRSCMLSSLSSDEMRGEVNFSIMCDTNIKLTLLYAVSSTHGHTVSTTHWFWLPDTEPYTLQQQLLLET